MTDHFDLAPVVTVQDWLQQRLVADGEAASAVRTYSPTGGGNKNDLLQSIVVSWTNDTPITQTVMGMVTRGGSTVALQARSRGFLTAFHGYEITATPLPKPAPDDYGMLAVSRTGIGMDVGMGGLLAVGTGFGIAEKRQPSGTAPFMPHSPGMIRVEAGETLHARVDIRFQSEWWENTSIEGGGVNTASYVISGDTRLDLWAFPAIVDPGPRLVPTVVGAEWDRKISTDLTVDVPAGTEAGDMIVAFMFNQWGTTGGFVPHQAGWATVNALSGGFNDVHFRMLIRAAGPSEPASYTFDNDFLAEAMVVLVTVRDASPYLEEWHDASTLRTNHWWERDRGHIVPSINRNGQLLLGFSGIAHALSQAPVSQPPPEGMTSVLNLSGASSAVSVAVLEEPPRPTGRRKFVPSKRPIWSGHTITAALLIPGAWPEVGSS